MHRTRVAPARFPAGLTVYPPKSSKTRRCQSSCSAGSSKIKIRTSSCSKANLALLHDEVRILIFDDPAEQEDWQRPHFCSSQVYSTKFSDCEGAHGVHDVYMINRKPEKGYCIIVKSKVFINRSCSILVLTTVLGRLRHADAKNMAKNGVKNIRRRLLPERMQLENK